MTSAVCCLAAEPLYGGDAPAVADVDWGEAGVDTAAGLVRALDHGDDAGPAAALPARHLGPGQQGDLPDVLSQAQSVTSALCSGGDVSSTTYLHSPPPDILLT